MKDDAEDDREHEEEHDRVRDVRVRDRDDADARETLWEPADRVRRQDALGDAAIERQRPDRDCERRQADARDEEAVERPEHPTQQDGRDHRRPDRPAVVEELGHAEPCETEHRRHREIDLAGDDDQRERERDDRDLPHVQADEEEVGPFEEVGRHARAVPDRGQQEDDEHRLPAQKAAEASPPPRRGLGLVGRFVLCEVSHELFSACASRVRPAARSIGRTRSPRGARLRRGPCSRTRRRSRRPVRC